MLAASTLTTLGHNSCIDKRLVCYLQALCKSELLLVLLGHVRLIIVMLFVNYIVR